MDSRGQISRRTALRQAGALAAAVAALEAAGPLAFVPQRALAAAAPSDIQFDISAFLSSPPQTFGSGVKLQLPPVHTIFLTAALERTPGKADQAELDRVLAALETAYPWGAANLVTFVSYGLPYFRRLPGGLRGSLVSGHMPREQSDHSQYVLEEAVAGPTDVGPANPHVHKVRFNVDVRIEHNDLLFTLRSDNAAFLTDVLAWFGGSGKLRGKAVKSPAWTGLLSFTSSRHMFVQMGLPKSIATQHGLPFGDYIQHQSPMWMGFADQQVNGSGPAPICTFAGNSSAHLTTAAAGDYFDHGAIQHLSHLILDMLQFFAMKTPTSQPGADGTFVNRVQYAFHAPNLVLGNKDQFTDGGGPSLLPNQNRGAHYADALGQLGGLGQGLPGRLPRPRVDQQVGEVGQADCQRPPLAELPLDDQGLLEQLTGPVRFPVVHLEQRHVVQRDGDAAAVAHRRPQVHRGLEAARPPAVWSSAAPPARPCPPRCRRRAGRNGPRGRAVAVLPRRSRPAGPRRSCAASPAWRTCCAPRRG